MSAQSYDGGVKGTPLPFSHRLYYSSVADKTDLVERRLKYIERQIALANGDVNVRFRERRPEGRGPATRHGMPQLPVGQHEVKNWPVLDLGEQPDIDLKTWRLDVGG